MSDGAPSGVISGEDGVMGAMVLVDGGLFNTASLSPALSPALSLKGEGVSDHCCVYSP